MSKRDLSPVSENEKRQPLPERKSISDEIGPSLEQNLAIDPPADGNVALRQIQANSRQNSTETSRYSTTDTDLEMSVSDTNLEEDVVAALKHISGEDSADSGTAKMKRQSSLKEYVIIPPIECDTKVGLKANDEEPVVWIIHQYPNSDRIMKITNTGVTMVPKANHECDLNRITFDACTETPARAQHVVFQTANTEKTLAITPDLQNDNGYTVCVGNASGLDVSEGVQPDTDARFFRLRFITIDEASHVLLESSEHHGQFLAYDRVQDRLQVLPHDLESAADTKFLFQIVRPINGGGDDSGPDNDASSSSSNG